MKKIVGLLFVAMLAIAAHAYASVPGRTIAVNGTPTKGANISFTVNYPHGSITLTCQQTSQVLNVTQKYNTSFLLDSPSWQAGPASCHALWYYIATVGGPKVTQAELDFAVDGVSPSPTTTPPPAYTPVVLVIFENRSYSQLAGHAPYLNGLAAQGRLFTNDVAIVHPSLPNYMAMTAGSTLGCSTDYNCTTNSRPEENLYHQLQVAGVSWNTYSENMTTNCGLVDTGSVQADKYIAHHNAVVYFTNVHAACLQKSHPLSQLDVSNLAEFTNIEVTNAHNMHTGTVAAGDAWAAANFPALLNAGARIIFTFDEGAGCCGQTVYTFVVGPGIAPSVNGGSYNDYSLLAGLEDLFGLPRILNAQTANPLPVS